MTAGYDLPRYVVTVRYADGAERTWTAYGDDEAHVRGTFAEPGETIVSCVHEPRPPKPQEVLAEDGHEDAPVAPLVPSAQGALFALEQIGGVRR